MRPKKLARLVYISAKLGERTPQIPKGFRRYIPEIEIIEACSDGIGTASSQLDIPIEQLRKLYKTGKKYGKAKATEYRSLIAREIEKAKGLDSLAMSQRLKIMSTLDSFVNQDEGMVGLEEIKLGKIKDPPEVQRWMTGFDPLDMVMGGLYNALLIFMAKPGQGKTTMMITLMEALKKTTKWNMIFFEEEFNQGLMLARMKPVFERVRFSNRDLLVTGGTSIAEIMTKLEERDRAGLDKNGRVVFVDSPDTMPGLAAENRRFELGYIYRQLVKIKNQPNTRLVIAASQPNRRSKGLLTLSSVAESWEKAWLVDAVIAIYKAGSNRVKMKNLKNRFGIPEQEVLFTFDWLSLEWEAPELDEEDW